MSHLLSKQLSEQFSEVYLDGKWVSTNFKEQLDDVDLGLAKAKCGQHNSIALLTFHINYYVGGVLRAYKTGNLDIRDKYSFDMPALETEAQWTEMKLSLYSNAEQMVQMIKKMSDEELMGSFIDEKYGNNYKNLHGLIEHGFYHLGQIAMLKKILMNE